MTDLAAGVSYYRGEAKQMKFTPVALNVTV